MEQLKANHAGKANPLPSKNGQSSTWTITDVTRHAKSGQVFCDITLQDPRSNGTNATGSDDASMKDVSTNLPDAEDKLQKWLQKHGPSMAPFTHPLHSNDDNGSPPYPFTMETVPAHQSALDPAVHKLYFLYQSKVHQDVDPFTCDLNDKEALNSSNSNMNMGGGGGGGADDPNHMEDDEWATPATSDGNDVLPLNRPGRLTPPPSAPASAHHPYNRNPPGFIDSAKRMLQREYSHVPHDRLKQIVKSFGSFYQFLVESPFTMPSNGNRGATAMVTTTPSAPNSGDPIDLPPGTYHQHYRVSGMLIAVGVVDVLPQGLSSVYLFYHPQFAHDLVPLGKYAILQEIEFARSLQLPYYYLGYYIESCTKMRYKAEYKPSELLCPTTYKWVDAALAQRIIPVLSPVHHCCTLYYEDKQKLEADLKIAAEKLAKDKKPEAQTKGMGNVSDTIMDDEAASSLPPHTVPPSGAAPTKSILKKPNPVPPNPHVDLVKMDVGVNVPVTLNMLHERGRDTVRPLLEDFVKEAGPELSQKCLVKFN
jgi:arginyl-tRNA--protein-N-Asp/Glu arginylyltransferase